jgi:hypothetical protein
VKTFSKIACYWHNYSRLAFGPFLRNWWHGTKVEQCCPFRVGMKTQAELKNRPFIIRVVQGNKHNNLLPCESLLESNDEVENDPTSAISKLYKKIFRNETRFSGTLMMGMEDNNILDELLSDLSFQPFSISIQKNQHNNTFNPYTRKTRSGCGFASSYLKNLLCFFIVK